MKKLLITIAHKIKTAEGKFWKEAYMFVEVTVTKGLILFPEEYEVSEQDARTLADRAGVPLATYLERVIMNTPELLDACKRNRVGYTHVPQPTQQETSSSQEVEAKNWTNFIIKVLTKKGDYEMAKRIKKYGTFQFPKIRSINEQK